MDIRLLVVRLKSARDDTDADTDDPSRVWSSSSDCCCSSGVIALIKSWVWNSSPFQVCYPGGMLVVFLNLIFHYNMNNTTGATLGELSQALKETLQYKGVLHDLKASLRAEVFSCLEAEEIVPPTLPNENLLINEIILEYLQFNGYNHAASVLSAESGQPDQGLGMMLVKEELGVSQTSSRGSSLPIIYGIVEKLKRNKREINTDAHYVEEEENDDKEAVNEGDNNSEFNRNHSAMRNTSKSHFATDPEPFTF